MNVAGSTVVQVRVTANSRLHFGMVGFGLPDVRQFGGVGAMVAPPQCRFFINLGDRDEFQIFGPHSERVVKYVQQVCRGLGLAKPPDCRLSLHSPLPEHVGLGSGTQLALSVTAGLLVLLGHEIPPTEALAHLAGRAARSAIGTHGFLHGGLLLEGGKSRPDEVGPLIARVELPSDWRFVLIRPGSESGPFGVEEQQAFARLPAVPIRTTDILCRIASEELLPAAAASRFDDFADALYRYSTLAGTCFAAVQGGPFNGPQLTALVDYLCDLGIRGVGQSSWGPTLFAAQPNIEAAQHLAHLLRANPLGHCLGVTIAAPANQGSTIEITKN